MLLLIDNYDSFTYNLFHYLARLGAETTRPPQRRDRRPGGDGAEPLGDPALARSLRPRPGRHLPRPDRRRRRDPHAAPRRLPRPPGDRPGLRRPRGARRRDRPRQARHHPPPGARRLRRPALAVPGHPLPQPDRRARQPAAELEVTAELEDGTIMGLAAPRRCRSTACSSTPSRSPPSTAARCSRNFLDLARVPA